MKRPTALARPLLPGIKVHHRDAADLLALPWPVRPRLLEVHLARRDVHEHRDEVLRVFRPLAEEHLLAVHQPFSFPDGTPLDLAAADAGRRRASARLVEEAAELARALDASFLIVHPAAGRRAGEPPARAEDLAESLAAIEPPVPILLENVPFWCHFPDGAVGRSTLGRTADELLVFEDLVAGYCLDTSHGWGAREPGSAEHVRDLLAGLGSRILHVHAAGSAPPDREGVPFAEAAFGPDLLRDVARAVGPRVACVPEIRGGEKDPRRFLDAMRHLALAGVLDAT